MTGAMATPIGIGAILLVGLLVAESRRSQPGLWLFKPLTAAVYLWIAVACGAADSAYGIAVLVALFLSWWGDVLLIPADRPAVFRAGVLAFLAAHLAYVVAFVVRGFVPLAAVIAAVLLALPAFIVWRWLGGRVPPGLAMAVRVYIIVITLMLAVAIATHAASAAPLIVAGALLFWLSDLFVARDRFVQTGFVNRLIGLPLYFVAQLLLALSVATA
jgi:uncharacterized membrane protein YhhN